MSRPCRLASLEPGSAHASPFTRIPLGGAAGAAVGAVIGALIGALFGATPLAFGGWGTDREPILKGLCWGSIIGAAAGSIPGTIGATIARLVGAPKRFALTIVGGMLGAAGVGALLLLTVTGAPEAMAFGAAIGQGIGALAALAGAAVARTKQPHCTEAPALESGIGESQKRAGVE